MRIGDIPEQLRDTRNWPGVDSSALDAERREAFEKRQGAIIAYLAGKPLSDVEKSYGVNRGTLSRLLKRCMSTHSDGRLFGFRALIPFSRSKRYERIKPATKRPVRGGLSGAMGQLFSRVPQLERIIEREISTDKVGLSASGRLYGLRSLQQKLLLACREAGLGVDAYPLNHDEKGYRSFSRWIRLRLQARVPIRLPRPEPGEWATVVRPYSVVELDGHKLDLRVRVRFTDPAGLSVDLECERLYVITAIDVCSRVVLGWHLVTASEYDRHDVLAALQDAIKPRRRKPDSTLIGATLRTGAGFVDDVCPHLAYACWDTLRVDNAASHLSEDTFEPICRFIGCRLEAGPVGEPTGRPFIERFFGTLNERVARQLTGATGRAPSDPIGRRGRSANVGALVDMPALQELLEVAIADYHGTPHDGLNGLTPLEALQLAASQAVTPIRTLPQVLQSRIHQLQPVHRSTVRGNAARSVAPYISLFGARYSSEVLQRTHGLVATEIRVYVNPSDMRQAWAYLLDGAELGQLHVLDGWRHSSHTLRLRKHILRERRIGKLKFAGEQDPVQLFAEKQRRQTRRSRKQGTIALQLEQAAANDRANLTPKAPEQPSPPDSPVDLSDLKVQNN